MGMTILQSSLMSNFIFEHHLTRALSPWWLSQGHSVSRARVALAYGTTSTARVSSLRGSGFTEEGSWSGQGPGSHSETQGGSWPVHLLGEEVPCTASRVGARQLCRDSAL